jgi:hypothetical protein
VHCLEREPVCSRGGELTRTETAALRRQATRTGAAPIFVAVLPRVSGSPIEAVAALHERLGRPGTYAVLAGGTFAATATQGFPHAVPVADAAFDAHGGEGPRAVLSDFIRRVSKERQGGGGPPPGGFASALQPPAVDSGGPSAGAIAVAAVAAAALLGLAARRLRR